MLEVQSNAVFFQRIAKNGVGPSTVEVRFRETAGVRARCQARGRGEGEGEGRRVRIRVEVRMRARVQV